MEADLADLVEDFLAGGQCQQIQKESTFQQAIYGHLDFTVDTQQIELEGPHLALSSSQLVMHKQHLIENPRKNLRLQDYLPESNELPIEHRLSNSLFNLKLSEFQLQIAQNKNGERLQIENVLHSLLEHNQIDIGNFTQNNLTSCGVYDHSGRLARVDYTAIPMENKRYTEEELFNKAPHPVRPQTKVKKQMKADFKKPSEQILEEMSILANLIRFDKPQPKNEGEVVMEMLSLQQSSDYNDLWQEILADIDINRKKPQNKKQADDFSKNVEEIIKQAEQEPIEQLRDAPDEIKVEQPAEQLEELPAVDDSEVIKISNCKVKLEHMKYQFAEEDESDLTHFYDELPKEKFAIQYPFELDDFQKRSILHLQKKESVFVAAHTSAGKTVIAEYGIALAIKHKRKVIYTSPIKALSNQKYKDFREKFDSVGIVTGDISINQEASCVIMTTEILRNSLYKGADMIRDIEWVIFDEVHYINNKERGVVWQETFIMLPEHIGIIMLSATVPNYMDFANWVGRTKHRKIFVIKTLYRPVPLEHHLFIMDKFHIIKEANGNFLREEYHNLKKQIHNLSLDHEQRKELLKAQKKKKIEERGFYNDNRRQQALKMKTLQATNKFIKNVNQGDIDRSKDREESRTFSLLIDECSKKNLLPCVIFCFSKKRIQNLVNGLFTTDLNTNEEKHKIQIFFNQALCNLKAQDRELEQFYNLQSWAMNGYAIHHGDLLPLAKEMVEIMFSQGFIKVLLATETFAMGINMPTKTVIFHSLRKVDGPDGKDRQLNSSEYVQMSGRAGRRGLDEKGTVIIMVRDPQQLPQPQEMVKMIDNHGESLISKFRLTYEIILNLHSSSVMDVKGMIQNSFVEDEKFSSIPSNLASIRAYKKQYDELSLFECPFNQLQTRILIEEYMQMAEELRGLNSVCAAQTDFMKLQLPKYGLVLGHNNELQLCLVLKVDTKNIRSTRNITILVVQDIDTNFYLTKEQHQEAKANKKRRLILQYDVKNERNESGAIPGTNNRFHYTVYQIRPEELAEIYSNKLQWKKGVSQFNKDIYMQLAQELMKPPKQLVRYGQGDQSKDQKSTELKRLQEFPCHNCQMKESHTSQNSRRRQLKNRIRTLVSKIDRNDLAMMGNFQGMLQVLKNFKFVSDNSILLKGRIARQVDIYVTQIMIQNVFDDLDERELAALLSGFVNQYRWVDRKRPDEKQTPVHPKDQLPEKLEKAVTKTIEIVRRINQAELDFEAFPMDSVQDQMNSIINFHLSLPIYEWACGLDFAIVCSHTDAPEGTIVRTIMRLDILLRNVKSGCFVIGNTTLSEKIDRCSELIKRDIIFAQSLYLT